MCKSKIRHSFFLISFLLVVFTLLLAMDSTSALAKAEIPENAKHVSGSQNIANWQNGYYILDGDVTASGQCMPNGELTIDLNGHTITMNGNGSYFKIYNKGCTLNITDTSDQKNGIIYASTQLVRFNGQGTFNLYAGTLDGINVASPAQTGGCVWMYDVMQGSNVFNMYGGTIRNFSASQEGGAVYLAPGQSGGSKTNTFNMYGGTITNCNAPKGAAVYIDGDSTPGYFYIKGGEKQELGGEPKAVINCKTYTDPQGNTVDTTNAIYNYGYFGIEGVVDIDGIVYLNQNNWASTITHYIKVTGRLVVTGDGYIDVDSAYPDAKAVCTGHTVVENVTQTVGGSDVTISQEEFYTYGSYFINSTKGLLISEGFDIEKGNDLDSNGAPANWPRYQADEYSQTYTYVDVMGQTMIIQASDSPGNKRQQQNYNYLIYTDRNNPEQPYKEFYSVKILKQDFENPNLALNGAVFRLYKQEELTDGFEANKVYYVNEQNEFRQVGAQESFDPNETYFTKIGGSLPSGTESYGLDTGITYIYLDSNDGKLMIDDGYYVLAEETAPQESEGDPYIVRGRIADIHIYHTIDSTSGQNVSMVEVSANGRVLSETIQTINNSFNDEGYLMEKEIVLNIKNSKEEIVQLKDYQIAVHKFSDNGFTNPLGGATFTLSDPNSESNIYGSAVTDENSGSSFIKDSNGIVLSMTNADGGISTAILKESAAPDNYYLMDGAISITVDDDNKINVNGNILEDGGRYPTTDIVNATNGGWYASLNGEILNLYVYDEEMPPTVAISARKYGTQAIEPLALAGAEFELYKLNGDSSENLISQVTSSDASAGSVGMMTFYDINSGEELRLDIDTQYVLKEVKAPPGYELTDDIYISVNSDASIVTVTQNDVAYAGAVYDAENLQLSLSIIDEAVYSFPETSGTGIWPIFITAVSIMTTCGVSFILFNNKSKGKTILRVKKGV